METTTKKTPPAAPPSDMTSWYTARPFTKHGQTYGAQSAILDAVALVPPAANIRERIIVEARRLATWLSEEEAERAYDTLYGPDSTLIPGWE